MYFEITKKQACNCAENCVFFRNLAKIYRTAILMNFSWCLRTKSQMSAYVMAFLNPLMLVVTDGHKYLNKPRRLSWRFPEVCMTFITTRHERVKRCSGNVVGNSLCPHYHLCKSRERRLGQAMKRPPSCKILNSSSRIKFNWFNRIHFKLILLILLLTAAVLLDIFSIIMQCGLFYQKYLNLLTENIS